jgi:DNA-binding response OmpR family regulator
VTTILVVDDEPIVREVVVRYLERDGFETIEAADGDAARAVLLGARPDLVVLDVMLPGTDGLELCRWIRGRSELPVILLTARGEESDRIVGLELGADDYVTKPFSVAELTSRVRAILRRRDLDRAGSAPPVRRLGRVELDFVRHAVSVDGAPVQLTPSEFRILSLLAEQPERVFSRRQIMEHLWQSPYVGDDHACDVHISNVRRKLESAGGAGHVQTVRGVGYKFSP